MEITEKEFSAYILYIDGRVVGNPDISLASEEEFTSIATSGPREEEAHPGVTYRKKTDDNYPDIVLHADKRCTDKAVLEGFKKAQADRTKRLGERPL